MKKNEQTVIYFSRKKNGNNRIYKKKSIDIKKLNAELKHKPMIGQMGMCEEKVTSLSHATHQITKFKYDKNGDLAARFELFNNDNGKMLKEMIDRGDVVLRPRGMGVVDKKGRVHNYTLLSCDFIPASEDSFSEISKKRKM